MKVRLSIYELGGRIETLAGAIPGSELLAKLIAQRPEFPEPTVVYLDFAGVAVATSSYLRESVLAFRDYCRGNLPNAYPVVANVPGSVDEELRVLLVPRSDAILACRLDARGRAREARVIGLLEEKQRQALDAVVRAGDVDAPTLANSYKHREKVGPTAWSNRLASLARKSLVISQPAGRSVRYRPVIEGIRYGT